MPLKPILGHRGLQQKSSAFFPKLNRMIQWFHPETNALTLGYNLKALNGSEGTLC
jgi:hypothetical protein